MPTPWKKTLILQSILLLISIFGYSQSTNLSCISARISSQPNMGTTNSPNYLIGVDANNCPTIGPTANYVTLELTNTCSTSVYIGMISFIGSSDPGVILSSTQEVTQVVGSIDANSTKNIFYHVEWPCNPTNADVTLTISFNINNGVQSQNLIYDFTKRRLIDASAGGLVTEFFIDNADVLGGYTYLTATYSLGNLPNTNALFAFQPISNSSFNSGCFQLQESQVIATSASSCVAVGYDDMNQVPNGGNGTVCDNANITVRYRFKNYCASTTTNLLPMTYAMSGNQIKKRIGTTSGTIALTSGSHVPTTNLSMNQNGFSDGDTVIYTLNVCNPSTLDSTSIEQIYFKLPSSLQFMGIHDSSEIPESQFSSIPAVGDTGLVKFVGEKTITGSSYKSILITPNSCKNIKFKAFIPSTGYNDYGTHVDTTYYKIGDYVSSKSTVTWAIYPQGIAGADKTIECNTTSTTLGMTSISGANYSWTPSTGLSSTSVAQPTASPSTTTTYTVTVTAGNGYSVTDVVVVTVNIPTADAGSAQTTTCTTPSVTIGTTSIVGDSYSWSPSTGLSSSTVAQPTANPSSTTTYTVTVTGSNGCTATSNVTVTVDKDAPTVNAGSSQVITCTSPNTIIGTMAISGNSYSWSPSFGLSADNIAQPTANPSSSTIYTLTVTGSNGCTSTGTAVVMVDMTPPVANAGSDATLNCTTPMLTLGTMSIPGLLYQWSPSAGLNAVSLAQPIATPTTNTTYTVTVTGSNGCTATDDVMITVDTNLPTADAGSNMTLTCVTPSGILGATSFMGNTYSWSPSTGLSATNIAQPTASPVSTTTYTLTVTSSNGCTASDVVTVTVNQTLPSVTINGNTSICVGSTTQLTANGGTSWLWSPIGNTNPIITVGAGSYTVTATASNGCTNTASVVVNEAEGYIGNYVWMDLNNNGVNDETTSSGLNGITVELWNATTQTLLNTTTTSNDGSGHPGYYQFTVCNSGDYQVKFPTSYNNNILTVQTTTAGTDNNSDANVMTGYSPVFTIDINGSGVLKNNMTIDAGYDPGGSVGNYVWMDINQNGLNDEPTSAGINGVTVELWNATTSTLVSTTTTANNGGNPGYYSFPIFSSGDYYVKFPTNLYGYQMTVSNSAAGVDNNSDPNPSTGITATFTINLNGTGVAKNNPTLDAGYYMVSPTITPFPNNNFCLGTNIQLVAYGSAGATFNWTTPAGFTGSIDNSVSGQSTITINNMTLANNGSYSVTQTLSGNTSLPQTITVNAGATVQFNYVQTTCVSGMGQVTLDVNPNTNMEYSMNGSAYQSSNVFTVPAGSTFIATARPIGTSCPSFYRGKCAYCPGPTCSTPPKDSLIVPTWTCTPSNIALTNYIINANTASFTSTGGGVFDATTCSSSPCTVHYTPSALDFSNGYAIITATTDDPDGAGPCMPSVTSRLIQLLNGLVSPSITTNAPVCENSSLIFSENSLVGNASWLGANGYTSSKNTDTLLSTPSGMHGAFMATISAPGCASVSATTNVNVIAAPNLNVTVTPHDEPCAGQGNGSIEVTVSGGSGSYKICYNSNLSNCVNGGYANFQYIAAGNYTVTVVDMTCPNNVFSYPVTIHAGAIVAPPSLPSSITACSGGDLVLSGTSSGTINWTYAGNNFNAMGNTVIRYNAQTWMSGAYIAKTISAGGCASSPVYVNVTVGEAPVITHVQVNCKSGDSKVDVTATGTGTLSYSMDGNTYQSSNLFDGLPGGNYTLHVKSLSSGCETTLNIYVPNCACPNEPVITVSHPSISCGTTAIPLTSSWTNVSGATWSSNGSGSFNITSGGTSLTNTYTPSSTDVTNGSVTLTLTTNDPDGSGPCAAVSKVIVIQIVNALTAPSITSNQTTYCTGDTVLLSANVNTPVHWTGVGGYVSDSAFAYIPNATNGVSGNYIATVSGNGCTTLTDTYLLTVAAAPALTVTTTPEDEHCEGHGNGSITVNVTGGSGLYKICDDFEVNCTSTVSPYTFKYLAPQTYTIYVSDVTCLNSRQTSIATVAAGLHVPPPTSAGYNTAVCQGDDLVLTATGLSGMDYLWTDVTNGWTDQGAVVTREDAQPAMSGPYRVVQLNNGCASTPVEINVLVSEYPQIVSVDTFCAGAGTGRITVNATNTSGQAIEYSINDGAYQSSNIFDSLPNGLYQIKARSVGGQCETVFNGVELYCNCNCDKDAPVTVYPNPNTGNFTVNAKLTEPSSNIKIELYDMTGRRIYTEYTEESSLILSRNIEIQHLAAGTYTLKVTVDITSFLVPITISNKN